MFEGERGLIEDCVEWIRSSQPAARVTSVDIELSAATGEFHDFEIRR